MKKLPEIGKQITYHHSWEPGSPTARFTIVAVDNNTGCIYLTAEDDVRAHKVLTQKVRIKDNKEVDATDFVWMSQFKHWTVNVEWDAWQKNVVSWEEFFESLHADSDDF